MPISKENVTRGYGLLEKFLAKKRARIANKLIPFEYRNGKILDIGCGQYPYFLLNTQFKEKFAIDKFQIQQQERINFTRLNLENNSLPFKDNFFDVVTMLAVFEHLEQNNLLIILKEIKRVLKSTGKLIITIPSPRTDKLLKIMSLLKLISKDEIQEHKGYYTHLIISSYLKNAGFSNFKLGYFEFFLNSWVCAEKD